MTMCIDQSRCDRSRSEIDRTRSLQAINFFIEPDNPTAEDTNPLGSGTVSVECQNSARAEQQIQFHAGFFISSCKAGSGFSV